MHKGLLLISAMCLLAPAGWCAESRLQQHPIGIWSIADGVKEERRWLIIHNLKEGAKSGVFHIEVIGRGKGQPVWNIRHISNHMAISEKALLRSVIKPLNKGAVYPESFENAYKAWHAQNNGKGGFICHSDVLQCLQER